MERVIPEIKELIIGCFDIDSADSVVAVSCVSKYWVDSLGIYRKLRNMNVVNGVLEAFPRYPIHGKFTIDGALHTSSIILRERTRWNNSEDNNNVLYACRINNGTIKNIFHYSNGRLIEAYFDARLGKDKHIERWVYNKELDKLVIFDRNLYSTFARVHLYPSGSHNKQMLNIDIETGKVSFAGDSDDEEYIDKSPFDNTIDEIIRIACAENLGSKL